MMEWIIVVPKSLTIKSNRHGVFHGLSVQTFGNEKGFTGEGNVRKPVEKK